MAAFHLIIYGRFWVIAEEASLQYRELHSLEYVFAIPVNAPKRAP